MCFEFQGAYIKQAEERGIFYFVPPVVIKQDNEPSIPLKRPFFSNQGPKKRVTAIVRNLLIYLAVRSVSLLFTGHGIIVHNCHILHM